MNWEFVCALPNLRVNQAIEWDWIALVSAEDDRVQELERSHPIVKQYLSAFSDSFGRPMRPAVVLAIRPAGEQIPNEPVLDFRNAISIASIVEGYRLKISNSSLSVPVYSESFDIYPIAPDKSYSDLIGHTPALLSFDSVDGFHGQSSSGIGCTSIRVLDQQLFQSLKQAWLRRFSREGGNNSQNVQLFRSIEIAYHATAAGLMYPPTHHAWGIKLALWVSAFEVLAYSKGVDKNKVIAAFFATNLFRFDPLNRSMYEHGCNLLGKLYSELYAVRNYFLHGNEVSFDRLWPFLSNDNHPFTAVAPLLYKIALLSKMDYEFNDLFEQDIIEYLDIAVPVRQKPV